MMSRYYWAGCLLCILSAPVSSLISPSAVRDNRAAQDVNALFSTAPTVEPATKTDIPPEEGQNHYDAVVGMSIIFS